MESTSYIGFGEAAVAFAKCLPEEVLALSGGYDIKIDTDRLDVETRFREHGLQCFDNARSAIRNADVIVSLVTADQAEAAALSAQEMKKDTLYLDGNSCSPQTKRRNAEIISQAGGCYVDLAIMAPVKPDLRSVGLLVSGDWASQAHEYLSRLGLNSSIIDGDVGAAASIKMIRSVAIKGMEAVLAECTVAGVRAGVDSEVFASLEKSFPGFGWADRSGYMLERMLTHGARRAAEMSEVSKTIEELGMPNRMSCAAASWHASLGSANITCASTDYRDLANLIINRIKDQ